MDPGEERPRPAVPASVDVELRPHAWPRFAALVTLHGEHDLSTSERVRRALDPLYGDVLVDLSDCSFIDSTVIGALLGKHQELEREAHRLDLIVPVENRVIARTVSIVGLDALLVVHGSSPDA